MQGKRNVQLPLHLTMPLHIHYGSYYDFKVFIVSAKVKIADCSVRWNKDFRVVSLDIIFH